MDSTTGPCWLQGHTDTFVYVALAMAIIQTSAVVQVLIPHFYCVFPAGMATTRTAVHAWTPPSSAKSQTRPWYRQQQPTWTTTHSGTLPPMPAQLLGSLPALSRRLSAMCGMRSAWMLPLASPRCQPQQMLQCQPAAPTQLPRLRPQPLPLLVLLQTHLV